MLQVDKVEKSFGKIKALDQISFEIEEGEFVFLTGPSGSGKTTLLKLILAEMLPDKGEIVFNNTNLNKLKKRDIPKYRQHIGTVFQDFKVLPERTVRENIEVALAVIGVSSKEWRERVNKVLEMVGLGARRDLFPSQLSGGELQRVSLARALVVNPKLILADEPTGNLDWDTSQAIMEIFENIHKEGKTILVATHHTMLIDKYGKDVIDLKEKTKKKKNG